jgi:hypothetical protein
MDIITAVIFTDLDQGIEMIIFESILTTSFFEVNGEVAKKVA